MSRRSTCVVELRELMTIRIRLRRSVCSKEKGDGSVKPSGIPRRVWKLRRAHLKMSHMPPSLLMRLMRRLGADMRVTKAIVCESAIRWFARRIRGRQPGRKLQDGTSCFLPMSRNSRLCMALLRCSTLPLIRPLATAWWRASPVLDLPCRTRRSRSVSTSVGARGPLLRRASTRTRVVLTTLLRSSPGAVGRRS